MDISTIKYLAVELRSRLRALGIQTDLIVLYGSFASGLGRLDSDIDLAVVSKDFGFDRFEEGSKLNLIASLVNPRIEAIPIGLYDFLNQDSISPILAEIKKNGTPLI